ncbi:MAG: MFS transporter [Chloroflexi bacterium]|nr:MFS transporter [Chloroflexota bacterium]
MDATGKHPERERDENGNPRVSAEAAPEVGQRNPFTNRDYRAWLTATVVTALGVGVQIAVVPLFIGERVDPDDRAAAIAGALIIQTLPGVFLTLLGGVVADRIEPRLLLFRATAVAATVAAVYVVLTAADVTIVWPVFALSAVVGAVAAFEQPARQGVLPQMVTRPQLQNGVIIGNMGFLAAGQFGGPALGGLVGGFASLTTAFALQTGLLALGAVLFLGIGRYEPRAIERRDVRADLGEGLRYVRGSRNIIGLLVLAAMPGVFYAGPLQVNMLLIVEDVLELPPSWLGILFGAFGAGMFVSSLLMTLRPLPKRGLLLALSPVLGGPVLALFGLSEAAWLSVLLLIAIGPFAAIFMNLSLALLQEQTEQVVMGRVMGVYSLMFVISSPIGFAQTALVSSLFGPQVSTVASALAGSVIGILLLVWLPVRKLR